MGLRTYMLITSLVILPVLASCARHDGNAGSQTVKENVVAKVNQSPVTQSELELAVSRLPQVAGLNADVREKLLESLIKSRAMALMAESQLSLEEKHLLELRVRAFREELLVKDYIENHADAEPVSNAMVKEYYHAFPEKFGGAVRKRFEYVTVYRELEEHEVGKITAWLAEIKTRNDWNRLVESAKLNDLPVKYQQADMRPELLQEPLKTSVANAKPGSAPVILERAQPYLVRVLEEAHTPPKPISEVSAEIRKRLAPVQLKKAIRQLSEQALQNVDVERNL